MNFRKIFIGCVSVFLLGGLALAAIPELDWTQRYAGNANDWDSAEDIALDSAGNVYVTGYAKHSGTDYDFVTIKYTPDGDVAWTQPYNRSSTYADYATAIAVDSNSDIVVAGYSYNPASGYDGIVVKYNSAGTKLWAKSYNYSGASSERLYDIAVDAGRNIYAVGRKDNDCLVVKYTPAGTFAWAQTYNGPANGKDILYQLVIDSSGNVYACGESAGNGTDQDCLTVKYSPAGTRLWAEPYNNAAANGLDLLEAIALDSAGNVYVTGSVETPTDSNYVTIKYNPSGTQLWTKFYTGTAAGWDEAYAIAVDSDDNVVVTGYSEGATSGDAATVKYNGQTGTQLWAARYNAAGDATDYAQAIATDRFGRVYIHGRSIEWYSADYLTICYDSNGIQQWKMNYDVPALFADTGTAMAFNDGIVYVTGYSTGNTGNYDYATVRYTQHDYCLSLGDLNGDCWVDFSDYVLFAENFVASQDDYETFYDITDTWLDYAFLIPQDCDINSPQNLMVPPMAYDDTGLILIWSKPQDYSDVASYNVYQNGSLLGNTTKLFYNVSGLTANTAYDFTVKSVLSGGESMPSNVCSVTTANTPAVFYPEDYGAEANGLVKDTAAIQAAINACTPGGKVHLQAGKTFLSGAIFVKSNMTLQIDGTLLGSDDPADYPFTSLRFPYYASGNNYMGLVNAYHNYNDPNSAGKPYGTITNVRICGSGVINGCEGYDASDPHTITNTGDNALTTLGFAQRNLRGGYPSGDPKRGDMVTVKGINQVYVGGWNGSLTLVYPAEHTIFISYCNDVTVADVNCDTFDIHNGDGINLCTTDTAYIFNSQFDTGDDCINMNAGQGLEGVTENVPVQNVRVFNCDTYRGHGGYVVGSFTAAWVQDSLIEDCTFRNDDPYSNGYGIRMKTGNNNGGGCRRITCRDIIIDGSAKQGIHLYSNYPASGYTSAGPGQFSGNIFKNITINSALDSIYIYGLNSPLTPHTQNLFENIIGNNSAYLRYCTDSNFVNVNVPLWIVGAGCSGNTSSGCPGCPF
jgi:exo-poly-alpha-galacturonosidase